MTESNNQPPAPANAPNNAPSNPSEPPDWYKNPPSWLQNQGNHNPPSSPPGRGDVMNAISGLPDQIVNAIREAFPPASAPQSPPADNAAPPSAPATPAEEPPGKVNSFAEWWWKR